MAKFLSIVISVFLLSACATITEDNDAQVAETQALPTSEMQSVESSARTPVEPARNELAGAAKKIPSKQEIKLIQAQLKAAGFDPGSVDGALGAKTMSALRRLQSGCAKLKDLFENPTSGILPQSGQMQTIKQSAADKFSSIMKLGLGLYRHQLNDEHFRFATRCGCTHLVVHLVVYFRSSRSNQPGDQPVGDDTGWGLAGDPDKLWTFEELAALKQQISDAGLELEAIENFDPAHWHDVLLDGRPRDSTHHLNQIRHHCRRRRRRRGSRGGSGGRSAAGDICVQLQESLDRLDIQRHGQWMPR